MAKKKHVLLMGFIICMIMVLFGVFSIWSSNNLLKTSFYELNSPKLEDEIKIIVLSDLHEHEFGTGNEDLINEIKEQSPDLVLMVGDFVNEDSENVDITCSLIEGLANIALVYFALGNHELTYMESAEIDLVQQLEAAGATVLEEEYIDIDVDGKVVRLGGMYDYAFRISDQTRIDFLEDFQNTDNFKIMMSHRPDSFIFGDASTVWDVDLVVSGHNHGGQVVVPFFGGVYGGDQGYFPEYVHGMYEKDDMHIFVTSGLGSNPKMVPRFNNRPEIAVLKLF